MMCKLLKLSTLHFQGSMLILEDPLNLVDPLNLADPPKFGPFWECHQVWQQQWLALQTHPHHLLLKMLLEPRRLSQQWRQQLQWQAQLHPHPHNQQLEELLQPHLQDPSWRLPCPSQMWQQRPYHNWQQDRKSGPCPLILEALKLGLWPCLSSPNILIKLNVRFHTFMTPISNLQYFFSLSVGMDAQGNMCEFNS